MTGSYLEKENWPECIPDEGDHVHPPEPWREITHEDQGVDSYPHMHLDACSLGGEYAGDICPYCGVPLSYREKVYTVDGELGELCDVSSEDDIKPCYHKKCYSERKAQITYEDVTQKALGDY